MDVIVYLCNGEFSGSGSIEFTAPAVGSRHKFLLFLAQKSPEVSFSDAIAEAARFGFAGIEVLNGKPLSVESLNSASYTGFTKHYEEALSCGSSLVWYP